MTRRRSLEGKEVDLVVELYENGRTIDEIAAQFGVSASPVRRALVEAGVTLRRRGWRTKALDHTVVQRYELGESMLQIARELEVPVMAIRRHLVAAGVVIDRARRRSISGS